MNPCPSIKVALNPKEGTENHKLQSKKIVDLGYHEAH